MLPDLVAPQTRTINALSSTVGSARLKQKYVCMYLIVVSPQFRSSHPLLFLDKYTRGSQVAAVIQNLAEGMLALLPDPASKELFKVKPSRLL